MNTNARMYRSRPSRAIEGCPAPDPKEIAANALVYVQQRPSRHVSHVGEGTPHALKFEPVTPEWLALMDKCGVTA